jgi:hypothetical protein
MSEDERMMILKLLKDGKITADEAAKLLETIERTDPKKKTKVVDEPEIFKGSGKFFRVKITDATNGKVRANIRIPLSVMGAGAKFGAHFAPQIEGIESEELMRAIRDGEVGKILDVFDDEDNEHVEIYIE